MVYRQKNLPKFFVFIINSMQIYASRGYSTNLREGRQPQLKTQEECHKLGMTGDSKLFNRFSLENYQEPAYTFTGSISSE